MNKGDVNNTIPTGVIDYSEYNQEQATRFCELISEGKSMRSACQEKGMVAPKTIFAWLRKYPEFNKQYDVATKERTEAMAEELLDIADDARNDFMADNYQEGKTPGYQLNGENIQRSRLRVDTRKFLMAKMKPKKYGEKLDLTTNGKDLPTPILGAASVHTNPSNPETTETNKED